MSMMLQWLLNVYLRPTAGRSTDAPLGRQGIEKWGDPAGDRSREMSVEDLVVTRAHVHGSTVFEWGLKPDMPNGSHSGT
ncbi:hypothetical protein EV126DRAFT_190714 [Verticillium dahliae]|nr:hypothetical protein EV126DRAFT_190714 [Verticillium dahliae]